MRRVAGLILAVLCSFVSTDLVAQTGAARPAPKPMRPPMRMGGASVTRISSRCRGVAPTKLTAEEANKARSTAEWAAGQKWTIDSVDVYRCKNDNLMELRVVAKVSDNDQVEPLDFLFFESHKSFKKAITLHEGMEMKVDFVRIDQDSLWSEGQEGAFVKFVRILKVE